MNSGELLRRIKDKKAVTLLDGGMGTLLAEKGWAPPALPEEMNMTHPETVLKIHVSYLAAGADIIETNTFGGSPIKLAARGLDGRAREINCLAASLARRAAGDRALVAGSIGPLGELLAPFGSVAFDEAVKAFRIQAEGLAEGGADFFLIETMLDFMEAKAAVIGAKEAAPGVPFVISFTFDRLGRTVTGTPPKVAARWAELAGAFGVGANCGVGPEAYIPVAARLAEHTSLPVFVYANAGLPGDGDYIPPDKFAALCAKLAGAGASVIGGCCGTTPEHTAAMREALGGLSVPQSRPEAGTALASRSRLVLAGVGRPFAVIGERINVSRKSPLRDEIPLGEWKTLRLEARRQTEAGAALLDVNVGVPSIDQEEAMAAAVAAAEQSSDLPLSIDSDSISVIEAGLRTAAGIPLINSFTAREDSLYPGLALASVHGAAAAVLPIDEAGLPETAHERIAVIKKIFAAADSLGFPRRGLIIDGLALAAGADLDAARSTLEVLAFLREEGMTSMLGVSNISHGMPARGLLNRTFLAMAIASGLSAAIMDPADPRMMESAAAAELLTGLDPKGGRFIAASKNFISSRLPAAEENASAPAEQKEIYPLAESPYRLLGEAVMEGDSKKAALAAGELLKNVSPLSLVNEGVIPALTAVGKMYDEGKFFLPQLISSASAAEKACEKAMELISAAGGEPRGKIMLATVEGDLHDLGKNVLGTILRSHGYLVTDLGKDVPADRILAETVGGGYHMVGLSALMTSTMKTMAATVARLRESAPDVYVLVGGASVSDAFASSIGAHGFAPDAVSTVRLVESLLGNEKIKEK